MININCNSFTFSRKSIWFSFILITLLSLYNLFDKPGYASEQPVLEEKQQNISEGNWLQRQINHFRSYPRLDRAYRLIQSEQFVEAAKEFKQYLKLNPYDIEAQLGYITVLYQLQHYPLVIQASSQLLKQQPNHYKALKYQVYAYQHLNRFESVIRLINKMKTHPEATLEDKQFFFDTLIDLFLTQHKYNQALEQLKEYLTIYPQNIAAQLRYITVLYQQTNYESVIDATNQLLKQQPDHYGALKYQAYAYQQLNRLEEAASLIEKIETHAQATPEERKFSLKTLIDLLLTQKKYTLALEKLEQYLGTYPDDVETQLRYIIVLHQSNKYQLVIDAANQLLKKQPNHYTALKYQAYAYQRLQKNQEFIRILDVISNHPQATSDDRQFYVNLHIDHLMTQKQYTQALAVYQALSEYPKEFKYYYRLGEIYRSLKQEHQAVSAYHNAYQQASKKQNKFKALMQLGFLEKKHKRWQKAEKYFMSAARLQPSNLSAMREIAHVAYQQKKYNMVIEWARKALNAQERTLERELLANALYQEAQYTQAIQTYQKLLSNSQDTQKSYSFRMKLGYAYFHTGDVTQAKQEFSEAVKLAQSDFQKYDAHITLGYLEKSDKNWVNAKTHYQAALNLDPSSIVSMWAIADIAREQKEYDVAISWFNKVVNQGSNPKVKKRLAYVHQTFGLLLYQQQKWALALEQFQAALEIQKNSRSFLYMAFIYKQLGQNAETEKYIHKALSNPKQLTDVELGSLYNELGQFYINVGQYDDALKAFHTSLEHHNDLETRLNIANFYRLTGDFNQARQTLDNIDETLLKPELQLNYFNQLAFIHAEQQHYQPAINALLKAENISSTAEQQYQLGLYYRKLNHGKKASYYLKQAHSKKPQNNQYAASLGYLYMEEERYDKAIKLFKNIVEKDPDFPNLYQDLGYAEMRNMDNDAAVNWFKKSIDKQTTQKKAQHKIDLMKREVSNLTDHYQFSLYQMYRANDNNQERVVSPTFGSSAIPSQAGINLTYQPPNIGYRDGRVLQLFSRMLWNTESQSLQPKHNSLQGGIGFRYKPFKTHGLFLGVEKLFEIGDNSMDDWLARAQYSWYKKFAEDNESPNHYYLSLYNDLTFFSGSTLDRSFSWEGGVGKKIQLGPSLFISPHLVANGVHQEPNTDDASYTEVGFGVSLKAPFGGNQYEADTSSVDLRLQYKNNIENDIAGWTITGVLDF